MTKTKALLIAIIYAIFTLIGSIYGLGLVSESFATGDNLYFIVAMIFILPVVIFLITFNYFISKISINKITVKQSD
jgi:uncharacterized RDD family membrane protein YckC